MKFIASCVSTWLRKRKAKARGIPFWEESFWPPYYLNFGGKIPGVAVLTAIYGAGLGDVVPVLQSETETHFYKVIYESRASGDDHIASPRQWDISYHHSERRR